MLKIKDFGFSEKQFTSNSIERHTFHLFFLGTSSNFPQTNLVSDFLLLLLFSSPVQEVIWSDFYIAIYLKYMKPIISRTYYSSVKIYSKNGQYYSLHIFCPNDDAVCSNTIFTTFSNFWFSRFVHVLFAINYILTLMTNYYKSTDYIASVKTILIF